MDWVSLLLLLVGAVAGILAIITLALAVLAWAALSVVGI